MKKRVSQPTLFDASQPRQVRCRASDLGTVLADLRERGAHRSGMKCARPGTYTLALDWDQSTKPCICAKH